MQDIQNNAGDTLILGIDSSSKTGCVAVLKGNTLLADGFENSGLTHSQTLMPLIKKTVDDAGVDINDIPFIAVTVGPGSFTGLRIGLSSVKGIAAVSGAECIGVSSLEAAAQGVLQDGIICAVMNARCKRVYNALFEKRDGKLKRLCDDRTIEIASLCGELLKYNEPIHLIGDGVSACSNIMKERGCDIIAASGDDVFIHGKSICELALRRLSEAVSAKSLAPKYIQLPQAQRELIAKNKGECVK